MNYSSYFKYKLGQDVRNKKSPDETGKIRKLMCFSGNPHYLVETQAGGKKHFVIVSEDMIEAVSDDEKICIIRHGNKVIAKDLNSARVGVARCNPSDTFDYVTGAKIAIERLFGVEEVSVPGYEKKPSLLNCKFVVTRKASAVGLTVGKIYSVTNGKFVGDYGSAFPTLSTLSTFEDLLKYMRCDFSARPVEIIKVVE